MTSRAKGQCSARILNVNLPHSVSLDMLNISHAKKAQDLATNTKYRTFLHEYTTLPTDINVAWAKKAYDLQSDVSLLRKQSINLSFKSAIINLIVCFNCVQKQYRSDLNWMKGVGWEASKSLDVQQAKKASDLASEVISKQIIYQRLNVG